MIFDSLTRLDDRLDDLQGAVDDLRLALTPVSRPADDDPGPALADARPSPPMSDVDRRIDMAGLRASSLARKIREMCDQLDVGSSTTEKQAAERDFMASGVASFGG